MEESGDKTPSNEVCQDPFLENQASEDTDPPSLVSMTAQLTIQHRDDEMTVGISKQQVTFCDIYDKDCSIVQDLGLLLNKKEEVQRNATSLADELDAPPIIKAKCKSNYIHSPASDLMKLPEVSMSTIQDLVDKLENIERTDLVTLIKSKFPDTPPPNKDDGRKKKRVEVLQLPKYHNLFEQLTSELDKNGTFNWRRLGFEYGIDSNQLYLIETGTNPAESFLVKYAYSALPKQDLQLSKLLTHMSALGRKEEIKELFREIEIKESDHSKSMKEIFAPNTDNMEKLCRLLNKKNSKGWQHLAEKWRLERLRYFHFIPDTNASATEVLLEWLMIQQPGFTIAQLDKCLQKIGREDACEILDKKFKKNVESQLL